MTASMSLDALSAAIFHVRREWSEYGYSIGIVAGYLGGGTVEVSHYDGSRFWFAVDRYGGTPIRLCDKGDFNPAGPESVGPMHDYLCEAHAAEAKR